MRGEKRCRQSRDGLCTVHQVQCVKVPGDVGDESGDWAGTTRGQVAFAGSAQSLDPPHSEILIGSFKTVVQVVSGIGGLSSLNKFQTTYNIRIWKMFKLRWPTLWWS